jgi:spermidine/putrescine transport system substrate-binding protein
MRDTVGLTMLSMDIDPASFKDDDFNAAMAKLQKSKDAGQLKGFTGNEYGKGLASGDIAACLAWTGDVVQLKADNPDLGYVLPATGHMIWSDNFVIPNKAQHKTNAEKLINYYYDPGVMAAVEDYVNYIPPVVGSKEILLSKDPEVAENQLIFPSPATLEKAHVFRGLTAAEETKYNRAFQSLVGG